MDIKNELYGLSFGCPAQSREKDCPFNEIDSLSFNAKVNWIQKLSKEEQESILQHHTKCTKNRR